MICIYLIQKTNKQTPIDLTSVGVNSLFTAYQICLSVGATIGRPRASGERPYKTKSNFFMKRSLYGRFFYSINVHHATVFAGGVAGVLLENAAEVVNVFEATFQRDLL